MSLGPRTRLRFGPCSHMASFLHDRAFSWHLQWHGGLCLPTVVFWKYSWAHLVVLNDRIMPMSDAVSSEGPKTSGIQQRYLAFVPYTRDFSVSLNLLMMLCTVDDKLCKAFAIWLMRNVVFNVFHNLFIKHRLENLWSSLLLRDFASLRHPFYS